VGNFAPCHSFQLPSFCCRNTYGVGGPVRWGPNTRSGSPSPSMSAMSNDICQRPPFGSPASVSTNRSLSVNGGGTGVFSTMRNLSFMYSRFASMLTWERSLWRHSL